MTDRVWLETAARIGHRLCERAIRSGGRCSWVGRAENADAIHHVQALGPDLYSGTAGVALFLGQLASVTGERATRTIALEAVEHALTEAHRTTAEFGFYSGFAGIAFSAARLSELLEVPELGVRARHVLDRFTTAALDGVPCDVLGGIAGTMLAYLAWPTALRGEHDLEICTRLGFALCDGAARVDDAWAWSMRRATGAEHASAPLTGLSHGASGMGVVLLELHARTGERRFREVGEGAFDYEQGVFDGAAQNWPDFRPPQDASTKRRPFAHGWCHGAPGIALARRRALALADDAGWQHDWQAALGTARTAAEPLFESLGDPSLCHGLAGCAEPLVEAGEHDTLAQLWRPLVERFAADGSWPSGLASRGPNPSLMLGTSGVGYTMLRLDDASVPSILLPLLGPCHPDG